MGSYVNQVKIGTTTHLIEPTLYATGAGTASAITAAVNTNFALITGVQVAVKMSVDNEINATLNISSTGAKNIRYDGSNIAAGVLKSGRVYNFIYDGTYWQVAGELLTKINTQSLIRPSNLNGVNDVTYQALINDVRANRLAFLPADQIIIEKTTDGGVTWVDAGFSDAAKTGIFSETRAVIQLPKINDEININCGLRITITGMKYNVPENTPETQKYNYWNSTYVKSCERYNQIKLMYFFVNTATNAIKVTVQNATGANPNNWSNVFVNNNYGMTGWSGNDIITFGQRVFGGGTTQTGNTWNWRITLMTCGPNGSDTLTQSNLTSTMQVYEIRGYGDTWWTAGNKYAASDHLYSWDYNKNATFPANITASRFIGTADKATAANITSTQYGLAYYTNTTGTFGSLGVGTSGQFLRSKGTSGAPEWVSLDSTYLKLDGSNNMTSDINIIAGDTDKFVNFWYNTNKKAGASWRIGMLGSGTSDANYFTIQSGTSTESATTWNDVFRIGQNTFNIYIPSTTASTSTSTGALTVAGGLGVAGSIHTGGGLEIKGHIAGDGSTTSGHGLYNGGMYHNAYNNIILHGDASTGSSGIAFVSDKVAADGTITNINAPSDRAFIQYHACGVTTATAEGTAPTVATSGEAGRFVIGIGNDSGDKIVLQAPGATDIVHQMGATSYPIPHTTNANGSVGGTTTPVYVDSGVIKAGTALGTASQKAESYFMKAVTSTDNAIVRFDGTAGQVQDSGVIINDKNMLTIPGGSKVYGTTQVNQSGYVKWATLTITGSYQNGPIVFEISRRGDKTSTIIQVQFKNTSSSDPDLNSFTYCGSCANIYIKKSTTSTWNLYASKTENQDSLQILRYHNPYNSYIAIEWESEHITDAVADWIQVSIAPVKVSGSNVDGTVAKATAANLTTTANAIAYYTDTAGTFGTKASADGALYATSANGTLQWGTLPVAQGGTGATTAANARTNLGLGSIATETATNYLKWQSSSSASTALYNFGVYRAQNTAGGTGPNGSNYYNLLNVPYAAASGNTKPYWGWQLGNNTENDGRLWYRTSGDNVWGDWQIIAHATTSSNDVGSTTQPVYMTSAGVITAGTALKALAYKDSLSYSDVGAAASSHNHNASDINAGTLAIARIADGSITNAKLENSKITIAGQEVSLGGSLTLANMGLSSVMHFRGKATVAITEDSTTDPTISGYTFGTNGASALAGDVILDKDSEYEYVWTADGTSGKWEKLGSSSSYKVTQTAITDSTGTADGSNTSTTFIYSFSQDTNGVVSAKTRALPTASTNTAGITKVGASGGAASYGHTHTLSIVTDSGTSNVTTLAENTTYKLTAGGTTMLFKTPADNNTWTAMTGATSSANGTVGYVNAVPPKDGYNTKFLRADGTWAVPDYIANAAYGNISTSGTIGQSSGWALANGDGLVVFDSSNSNKLERTGITFDASTETQCLTKKGTWKTFGTSNLAIGTTSTTAMAGNTNVNNVTHTKRTDAANNKYYVTGTTSSATNTNGDIFDTGVYVTTVDGGLSAVRQYWNYSDVDKAYSYFNNTTQSIDFVFI